MIWVPTSVKIHANFCWIVSGVQEQLEHWPILVSVNPNWSHFLSWKLYKKWQFKLVPSFFHIFGPFVLKFIFSWFWMKTYAKFLHAGNLKKKSEIKKNYWKVIKKRIEIDLLKMSLCVHKNFLVFLKDNHCNCVPCS